MGPALTNYQKAGQVPGYRPRVWNCMVFCENRSGIDSKTGSRFCQIYVQTPASAQKTGDMEAFL
jgi:hypothetical protein